MRSIHLWLGVLTALAFSTAAAEPASYRAGVRGFVSEMVREHGFDERELVSLMDQADYSRAVVDAMRRPFEAKPWYSYRALFLTAERIRTGVSFWRDNRALLDRARTLYGVPQPIIVAIIGVETKYGDRLGGHRVLDALTTLGFSYPPRVDFFRRELEEFLLLTREERLDTSRLKGSYAGAVGLPQFIPSSYRAYAVDFDHDGRRDLWERADAIGSVGNYLRQHGWKPGQPVAFTARVTGKIPRDLTPAGKKPVPPSLGPDRLRAAGIIAGGQLPESSRATLIRLRAPEPEYWLGLENFYAITRYNHSNLYAMTVYQLSREIGKAYEAENAE